MSKAAASGAASPQTPHIPLLGQGHSHTSGHHNTHEDVAKHNVRQGKLPSLLMGFFGCCGGGGRKAQQQDAAAKPRRQHRRHRRQRGPAHKAIEGPVNRTASALTEDWFDCRDNFSIGDAEHISETSPVPSAAPSPRHSFAVEGQHERPSATGYLEASDNSSSSVSSSLDGQAGPFSSCLSMVRGGDSITGMDRGPKTPRPHAAPSRAKPPAGFTMQRLSASVAAAVARNCWDEVDASSYRVRCLDYMRTKQKGPSDKAVYRLLAVDMFATAQKAFHVAKHVHLPPGPPPVLQPDGGVLPPLLIINIQLPEYPATLFGASDGPGVSIVYYFGLPDEFDPVKFGNQKALGLLERFVANGREADGQPTRERLKMIPRVVNCDEWAAKGPLSGTEYKLLTRYNEMPVLTRPQQAFFLGPTYLEVDLDVHTYTFLARKAINSFHSRLKEVVWENAFVIQGNSNDELPEQLLAAGRIYRAAFDQLKSFEEYAAQYSLTHGLSYTPDTRPSSPHISTMGTAVAVQH